MHEQWKDVPGFEGRYEVSNLGRVASNALGHRRIMRANLDGRGYPKVMLQNPARKMTRRVHRLVAEAFIPNPSGLATVNHIDGDKTNNAVSNLEWASYGANNAHAVASGLFVPLRGEQCGKTVLDAEKVIEIRRLLASGRTQRSLAEEYGVHKGTISGVASRRSWAHI